MDYKEHFWQLETHLGTTWRALYDIVDKIPLTEVVDEDIKKELLDLIIEYANTGMAIGELKLEKWKIWKHIKRSF